MSGHKSSQYYEYLLFGSVSEKDLPPLLHRLRGLCDFSTTGGISYVDRELAFKIGEGKPPYGRGRGLERSSEAAHYLPHCYIGVKCLFQ